MTHKISRKYNEHDLILCGCGCGQLRTRYDKKGRLCFYINHHAQTGEMHPNFNNGKNKNKAGYIRLFRPEHRFADPNGWVYEHRIVFEEYYQCCLIPKISAIHHKNDVKDDNRIENLEGMSRRQHKALHLKEKNYYREQHHRGKR